MRIDYQNLNDDRRHLTHGRVWLRTKDWWQRRRFGQLEICWTIPCSHCGWSVKFGGGDSGRNLGLTFAVPLLCTLYVTAEGVFARRLFEYDFDRGDDREIGVYFFGGSVWWNFWVGTIASWSQSFPWCKKWRQGNFRFANLLGKEAYSCATLKEGIPVEIAMPEGVYHGTAKIERSRWKRPFWLERVQISTYIEVPRGIPFSGKGENSWDCGDDGLWGAGCAGEDVAAAVESFRARVLKNRKRYGQPSDEAIAQALGAA